MHEVLFRFWAAHPWFMHAFYNVETLLIFYVAAINLIYGVLIVIGFFTLTRFSGRIFDAELDTLVNSPLLPHDWRDCPRLQRGTQRPRVCGLCCVCAIRSTKSSW